jgi:hypothetical protein
MASLREEGGNLAEDPVSSHDRVGKSLVPSCEMLVAVRRP